MTRLLCPTCPAQKVLSRLTGNLGLWPGPLALHLSDRARVCRWLRAPSISAPSLKPHLWFYLPHHPQEADVPKRDRMYVHCMTTGFNLSTRLAPSLTVLTFFLPGFSRCVGFLSLTSGKTRLLVYLEGTIARRYPPTQHQAGNLWVLLCPVY